MKQMRRYLALLLVLTLVLGMLPPAAAEETAEAPVVLMEDLPEIEVADDQELLAYLEDGEAQVLLVRDEMTLTLARNLESNDELFWAENGVLHVEGAVLTCAAIDMMAFDETELAEAMGEEPFWNMDAPYRNIWVFEGVDLAGVELPANRTLSWVAPMKEDNVIEGAWPVLQTLFVPDGAGLTIQTNLTVENAAIVNGALFLENGAEFTANMISGTGSCWWTVNETVNCENIEHVIYPNGNEYIADNGALCVDVYDVPSLKYYLTDGVKQEVNVSADLRLPVETDIVSEDGLYANFRYEDDESGRRGNLYRLEVLGEGTLTVAGLGLAVWEQAQLDAAIAGDYPIQVSEGGHTNLFLEGEFQINKTTVLPSMTSLLFGAHGTLTLADSVRLTSEAGLWNINYEEDLEDLNKGLSLKHNALIDAVYYNPQTEVSVRVYYMSEQDFLTDWAAKKEAYPLLEAVLISTDVNGEPRSFDLTGDWTVGELREIVVQDGTTVNIKSTAKVDAGALYVYNPQGTDACLLTVESGAQVQLGYLNVEASAYWPADVEIFFDSADIRYYAPMLFFRGLGWDEERQVHVDDFDMGAYSEWPLRISPTQEKVGYIAYCYPKNPEAGAPSGMDDWEMGPLAAEDMGMTENIEVELLEEDLRDEETVPWESYRFRTDAWSSKAELGIGYETGGYALPLHVVSELSTIECFSAPSREEQYAVKDLYCDTFGTTQEEYYLIFQPEYEGQYLDHVEVLHGEAKVTATEDSNIWKITVTGTESFHLDLCLYVGDDYSEPWEWGHGIWVECGYMKSELVEIQTAEKMLEHLTNDKYEQLAAMQDLEITLTEDIRSTDYVGANFDDETGKFYQTKFVGDGTLYVSEYEAAVNNADDWADALAGVANVDAESLYVLINDTVEVGQSVEWGDTSLLLTATADLRLAPGVMVSSRGGIWNMNYAAMEGDESLTRDHSLKHNALVDVLYSKENGQTLRVLYADEETFLNDLPGKLEEYSSIDLIILSTDDEDGETTAVEIDEAWSVLQDKVYSLIVQDGTTLTISTDLELGELSVEDADDENTRAGVVAVNVTGDTNLTVRDTTYIEGDFAFGSGNIALNGDVHITGNQPGLIAMWLGWDDNDKLVEDENNTTSYLGRILPVDEHPMLFFVQSYEDGQWIKKPVSVNADGVEIKSLADQSAAGQDNGEYFVSVRAQDWFCEYEFTAELDGVTYTMYGDSYPNEVEYFSDPWDNYDTFLNGVPLSPVNDNVFYAVVTNGDLQWSNVALTEDVASYATIEDTDDNNVKKITISAENARKMLIDGNYGVNVTVTYDATYPEEDPRPGDARIWTWVENGMVFVPNGEVSEDTLEFPGESEYMNNNQPDLYLAPTEAVTGVLYYVWYNEDDGKWVADAYSGNCLWQDGDSVKLSPNDAGQTIITGVRGGDTYIHHTGFDENGNPNEGGIWHGIPFPVHVGNTREVQSVEELKAALADETVTDISVHTNFKVSENLYVNKPLYIGETGHITVEGNAVLTLEEPGFWDSAENNVDYWLMFMDFPEEVRTHYFCGNQQAAQELAAVLAAEQDSVAGMHTDIVTDGPRRMVFDESWPSLNITDSFLWTGNVYVIDGADLTFDRLRSQGHGVSDDTPVEELSTMVEGLSGSLTVKESLILRGNAYWTPGFQVNLPEDCNILGAYPHLAYRWLENNGRGWFEQTENRMQTHMGSISREESRFLVFYATVPQVSDNGEITWVTEPVYVTDGKEGDSSAVSLLSWLEHEEIADGEANAAYFTRISAEPYDWDETITVKASIYGYYPEIQIPVSLPELGFFSEPKYSTDCYLSEIKLSENPDENVFYLIVHTPENAGHWMHHYEFHDGADRIHAEDLGDGIIEITLQDGVDIYEGFHLHAEVFWQDQENMWTHGCGIGVNGAMNTAPYLSQTWLDNWDEGWFVSDHAMNNQGRDFQTPWFDEQWKIFFLNQYDAERGEWISTPVEVTVDENAPVDLIHMTDDEEYPKAEDAYFPGYYYRVVPHADVWDEEVVFTYTMGDGTVLDLPMYIGRSELGFYSDAKICNENYITNYRLKPGGDNVFYLGIDIPELEDHSLAYHVVDVWAAENEWAHMVDSIWRLSDQLWQVRLTEDAARAANGFNLQFRAELEFPDGGREHWGTGIWCDMGNLFETADAGFELNGNNYFFYEGTDAVLKHFNTGEIGEDGWEIWQSVWLDEIDVEGFSYDLGSNTITLMDAKLESLYMHYWRGWHDENGDVHVEGYNLPNADVTMILNGTNTIAAADTSALGVINGTKLTIAGTGTLTLTAGNTGELYYGNPAIGLWGGGSLTITDNVTVHAETEDYGMERDENGDLIYENGAFGIVAIQGDYNIRSSLTVAGNAKLNLAGTRGGMESVSTVTFKEAAVVTSQEIMINGEPSLRPSMTVTGDAEVTVTAIPRDRYEHALHFLDGGRLYMKGGTLTVDNTALTRPECALGFASNMGSLKGGLQISGGVLNVTAAGGTGIGLSTGNSYQQSGGTVNVTVGADNPEYWGSWGMTTEPRTEFVMTGGEATFIGTQSDDINSAGILYRSNDGTIAGGSLNAYGVHRKHEERNLISGLYVSMGSLSITGGTHSFKVIDSDGEDDLTMRGIGLLVHESGYLAFTGGSTRAVGYCAAWSIGPDNHITLGKNIHAVSSVTDNELNMVYYEETYTDETGTWIDQIHWFEEDNLVTYPEGDAPYDESDLSHDVTISGNAGTAVVNAATIDLTVTNGAPALGAKMSVRAIISIIEGGEATVDVTLPQNMQLLPNSISLNDVQISSLSNIKITGPVVLRFDVVPMQTGEQSVYVTVNSVHMEEPASASYMFTPAAFHITAPSTTKDRTVAVNGRAYPGYKVLLENIKTSAKEAPVSVTELGNFAFKLTLPEEGVNRYRVYLVDSNGNSYEMRELVINYDPDEPVSPVKMTVTNFIHNSYGQAVPENIEITYPSGRLSKHYYTYWPGQDDFFFEVILDGDQPDKVVVLIELYDGTVEELELHYDATTGIWKGTYRVKDQYNPPAGYEVHWLELKMIKEDVIPEKPSTWPGTIQTPITTIMDPSGFVYEGSEDNRVEGATVTLEYGTEADGVVSYAGIWDAEAFGQSNGYLTNVYGEFKWDVPTGWWRVKVEKDGYETTYSEWMRVPPPQTGVKIELTPTVQAELYENVTISEDGKSVTMYFTQMVQLQSLYDAVTVTDASGNEIAGMLTAGQIQQQSGSTRLVKDVVFVPDEPVSSVKVSVSAAAKAASGAAVKASEVSGTNVPVAVSQVTRNQEENTATIMIVANAKSVDESSKVLVASYDENGKYLGMIAQEAVTGRVTVKCPASTDEVKAFVVDSMDTMTPVCEAVSSK